MMSNTKEFIAKAKKIHGDKYDYSKVNYINNHTKIIIICLIHGIFEQRPSDHLFPRDCQKCSKLKKINPRRKTTEQFIHEAKKIHNNVYDYSKVTYKNEYTKVVIICKIHGEFEQLPQSHLKKAGCKKCGVEKSANTRRKTQETFIKQATEIHNNFYDYSEVEYKNHNTKVKIICKKHGEFYQTPGNHLSGKGCMQCGIQKSADFKIKSTEEFIYESNLIHNFLYDYSKTKYINSHIDVEIICKKHGIFEQNPTKHVSEAHGCPKCKNYGFSQICIKWLTFISNYFELDIQCAVNKEKVIKLNNHNYRVDGYYENKKKEKYIIFEFHGCFWHGCQKCFEKSKINNVNHKTMETLYEKTKQKEKDIRDNNFELITIWECEFVPLLKDEKKLKTYLENLSAYFFSKNELFNRLLKTLKKEQIDFCINEISERNELNKNNVIKILKEYDIRIDTNYQ